MFLNLDRTIHRFAGLLKGSERASPLRLREPVVFLVLLVGVEVEDALDEMLREHQRVLLQQQVHQAVLAETSQKNKQFHNTHQLNSRAATA